MRALILSGNTGEGHNSAARALQQQLEGQGDHCEIVNGLAYLGRVREAIACHGHVLCYRHLPQLYGLGYRIKERASRRQGFQQKLKAEAGRSPGAALRALEALLNSGKYDVVLCTHVFAAQLVSRLHLAGRVRLPGVFLATDYTCSPYVNQLDMDAWLIPHAALLSEFMHLGIPKEKVIATGLPVRQEFLHRNDPIRARKALGLPPGRRIALFSSGSMGGGPMRRLVRAILEQLPDDALLVAICGNNHALERALREEIRSPKLKVLGYVERMADYMDAADLFLTKPGGISVSEAAHKGLPMLLYDAVPGCESHNLEFFVSLQCAAAASDPRSLAERASSLLTSPRELHALQENCLREFGGVNPAASIRTLLHSYAEGQRCGVESSPLL